MQDESGNTRQGPLERGVRREIQRIEDFEDGDFACLKCGKKLHLYFNGGELDRRECCGMFYQTEYLRVDLVIYENA